MGVLCARLGKNGNPSRALNGGTYLTCGVFAALTFIACLASGFELRLWGAAMVGMLAGVSSAHLRFLHGRRQEARCQGGRGLQSGPAFTILSGFSYGLLSRAARAGGHWACGAHFLQAVRAPGRRV